VQHLVALPPDQFVRLHPKLVRHGLVDPADDAARVDQRDPIRYRVKGGIRREDVVCAQSLSR
jgi:hypothetical protein